MSDFKPANPDFADVVRTSFAKQSMMQTLGADLVSVEAGCVVLQMPPSPGILQQHGFVHAGAVTSIADSACGYAALSLMPAGRAVLSVEFKINLLAPAVGDRFVAEGHVKRAGRQVMVCAGDVFAEKDGSRKCVATMLATMMVIDRPEMSG